MKHKYLEHKNCTITNCIICDGGLSLCTKCNGFEGSLTTDCPEEKLSDSVIGSIYKGEIDFVKNIGWLTKPSIHSPVYIRNKQLNLTDEIQPEDLPL